MKKNNVEDKQPNQILNKKIIATGWIVLFTIIILIVGTFAVTGSYISGTYNQFISAKQDVDNSWSNVKTEYQRRGDLFYNLAEVVKSYKDFEQTTMIEVARARSGQYGTTKTDEINNMQQQDKASGLVLANLYRLQEAYPELKSNTQYENLMGQITDTENTIRGARQTYNELSKTYNKLILKFPALLVARYFGFQQEQYYENEASTNLAPKINMSYMS